MAKWADYLISAVRYKETDTSRFIVNLRVHRDLGDSVGPATEMSKAKVIELIDDGDTFATIYKDSNRKWNRGEDVRKVVVNGRAYLRTDANKRERDNLGELPEF